jgi:hypothetical protein
MKDLITIGRVEKIDLPQLASIKVPAKIDTGADVSSIWASNIKRIGSTINVTFFGPESKYYDGKSHEFISKQYTVTRIANSFGHKEDRYKVKLKIKIKKKLICGTFTLADRSAKLYPIIIGRSLLHNKFLVDVSKGSPLKSEEKARRPLFREKPVYLRKRTK